MTTTATPEVRRKKRTDNRRTADISALSTYLNSLDLGVTPSIHVNGYNHSNALVTVDFGSPLKPVKMSMDENQEFSDHLRRLARDILGREANIRISHDGPNGVYWASVA